MDNLPVQPIQPNQPQATSKKRLILSLFVILILLSTFFLLNFFGVFSLSRISPLLTFLPTKTQKLPPPQPTAQQIKTAKMAAKVDEIIDLIKNPDPALLQKYPPKFLKEEQTIIIYGGIPGSNPGFEYSPDSLFGVKDSLKRGNQTEALERLKQLFPRLSQPIYLTTGQDDRIFWDRKKVLEYDPDGLLIKLDPKWVSWSLSAIKGEAVVKATELGYQLR